jgi:hypothetical protein
VEPASQGVVRPVVPCQLDLRMLDLMAGIISGSDWLKERLRHLEVALKDNPSEADREAIQAEIDQLKGEARMGRRRFRRWVIWGGRPPEG